ALSSAPALGRTARFVLSEHDPEKWVAVFGKDHAPNKVRSAVRVAYAYLSLRGARRATKQSRKSCVAWVASLAMTRASLRGAAQQGRSNPSGPDASFLDCVVCRNDGPPYVAESLRFRRANSAAIRSAAARSVFAKESIACCAESARSLRCCRFISSILWAISRRRSMRLDLSGVPLASASTASVMIPSCLP